jgi:hypothetical protein
MGIESRAHGNGTAQILAIYDSLEFNGDILNEVMDVAKCGIQGLLWDLLVFGPGVSYEVGVG